MSDPHLTEWPAVEIRLGASLTDDNPVIDTDAFLVLDTLKAPRIEVSLDLGDLGATTLYVYLDPQSVDRCARLMIAHTYLVGERVYNLRDRAFATVRETADAHGTVLLASDHGTYRLSAQFLTRPPTTEEN